MRPITGREIRFFQRHRKTLGAQEIARQLGGHHSADQLQIAYEEFRKKINKGVGACNPWRAAGIAVEPRVPIAPDIEADRDIRRGLHPINLTAAMLGDPLPGYSALDRRKVPA